MKCTKKEAALMYAVIMRYVPDGLDMMMLSRIAQDMDMPLKKDGFIEELSKLSNEYGDKFGWTGK